MRPGAIAVIALVAAGLGAAAVLVVAGAAGWIADDGGTRTVVLSTVAAETSPTAPASATGSLVGNGFDPAQIYASRSQGVVTIYSYFPNGQRSQGSGFIVSDEGHVLTNSHVVTNAGTSTTTVRPASQVYVVFADGDRIPGSIVGWDLFNDTGLVKVDPE